MWVEQILKSCQQEGVSCVIDKKSHDFENFRGDEKNKIKLFLHPLALKQHDDEHPERIEALASRIMEDGNVSYYVIVKDRDIDIVKDFHKWCNTSLDTLQKKRTLSPNTECIVCYKTPNEKLGKKKTRLYTYCKQCSAFMCLPCLQKIEVHGYHKCPQCRYLCLEGPTWGAPYQEKTKITVTRILQQSLEKQINSCDALKHARVTLGTLLEMLDGETKTYIRCNHHLFDLELSVSKYSYTNRYTPDNENKIVDVKEGILDLLTESVKADIRFINIFVVHNTYKIDKEKEIPIKEIAAFRFSTRFGLLPLSIDTWDSPLKELNDAFTYQKVEMLEPYKSEPQIPDCIKNIITSLKKQHLRKCITFIVPKPGWLPFVRNWHPKKKIDGNELIHHSLGFVIDNNENIEMMSDDYVYNRLHHMLFDYNCELRNEKKQRNKMLPVVLIHVFDLEHGSSNQSFSIHDDGDDGYDFRLEKVDCNSHQALTQFVISMALVETGSVIFQ